MTELSPAETAEPQSEVLFLCNDGVESAGVTHPDPFDQLDSDTQRRVLVARAAVRTMDDPETMQLIRTLRGNYVRAVSGLHNDGRRMLFSALADAYARDEDGVINRWERKAALARLEKRYNGTLEVAADRLLVVGFIGWMALAGALPQAKPSEAEPPSPYLWLGVALREHWFELANLTHDRPSATIDSNEGNG